MPGGSIKDFVSITPNPSRQNERPITDLSPNAVFTNIEEKSRGKKIKWMKKEKRWIQKLYHP